MEIKGKVHCFFEQSGTFKNEFIKLGIPAEDYDIQNNFNQTDHIADLFQAIDDAYDNKPSLFDKIGKDDLIIAFYPCIYFNETSQCAFRIWHNNYRKLNNEQKIAKILEREKKRDEYYSRLVRFTGICLKREIRLVIENPWSGIGFLRNNYLKDPDVIDEDRRRRGDYFKKPTAFWFWNCNPTSGYSFQKPEMVLTIRKTKGASEAGLCSEDRSMISTDYARNFIYDFILGKEQENYQGILFQ